MARTGRMSRRPSCAVRPLSQVPLLLLPWRRLFRTHLATDSLAWRAGGSQPAVAPIDAERPSFIGADRCSSVARDWPLWPRPWERYRCPSPILAALVRDLLAEAAALPQAVPAPRRTGSLTLLSQHTSPQRQRVLPLLRLHPLLILTRHFVFPYAPPRRSGPAKNNEFRACAGSATRRGHAARPLTSGRRGPPLRRM